MDGVPGKGGKGAWSFSRRDMSSWEGDGDRERFRLLMAVLARDGVDGVVELLFMLRPGGKLSECTEV